MGRRWKLSRHCHSDDFQHYRPQEQYLQPLFSHAVCIGQAYAMRILEAGRELDMVYSELLTAALGVINCILGWDFRGPSHGGRWGTQLYRGGTESLHVRMNLGIQLHACSIQKLPRGGCPFVHSISLTAHPYSHFEHPNRTCIATVSCAISNLLTYPRCVYVRGDSVEVMVLSRSVLAHHGAPYFWSSPTLCNGHWMWQHI